MPTTPRPRSERNIAPSSGAMEAALREQIWASLGPNQTGPFQPIQHPRPPSPPAAPGGSADAGSHPPGSARDIAIPRSSRIPAVPQDEGMPLGYVVASAVFLAIALVGFSLWLAFEVISL